jgi:predicted secreted protein
MTPEERIYAALNGTGAVTALVGTRISPAKRGQAQTLPAITFQRISNVPSASVDGNVANLQQSRVQVDAWAMTTQATASQGIQLKRGNAASPEVFTKVAEITGITGPSGSAKVIDASSVDSSYVEKLIGLLDEGQVSFDCNFIAGDTAQDGLRTDRAGKILRNFEIILPDSPSTTLAFAAFVTGLALGAQVNDKITSKVTLEVSGAVTWS